MPTLPYVQLTALLFFHSWKSEGANRIYAYDDPDVNTKLGIKRDHGTTARSDHPIGIPEGDRASFSDFISACMNATQEQLRTKKMFGSINGQITWLRYCGKVVFRNFNRVIECQMMEAGLHPQQLLEGTCDKWNSSLFTYNAQGIGRMVAQEIFGEILVIEASNLVHHEAGPLLDSAVVHNYDRLRRAHIRVEKNLGNLQRGLDEAMKSKHPLRLRI
jgi:hypothetical protein